MKFTYLFFNPASGLTKIGKSASPIRRLAQLEDECCGKLVPLFIFNDDREKLLHRQYAEFRVNGEWFNLPDNVRDSFGTTALADVPSDGLAKVTFTLSREILRKIDSAAKAARRSRSNYIAATLAKILCYNPNEAQA